ncbi:hypothetical protein [Endozoicomonas sp. Mp262]|uniref:hypothetical protein n=1 Tax=Endozoicomonas sp. Mp262 TaxID=2919499 RepID=UPI0021D990E7
MGDPLKTGEVNYKVSYSPNPLTVNTSLSINNTTVKVTINDVPKLDVTLTPQYSWNPVNDVLTSIGSLANLFSSEISGKIVDEIKGVSVDIYTIPDITIDQSGVNLTLSPSNLKLENSNGLMMVSGDISVSGL